MLSKVKEHIQRAREKAKLRGFKPIIDWSTLLGMKGLKKIIRELILGSEYMDYQGKLMTNIINQNSELIKLLWLTWLTMRWLS